MGYFRLKLLSHQSKRAFLKPLKFKLLISRAVSSPLAKWGQLMEIQDVFLTQHDPLLPEHTLQLDRALRLQDTFSFSTLECSVHLMFLLSHSTAATPANIQLQQPFAGSVLLANILYPVILKKNVFEYFSEGLLGIVGT